MRIIFIGQAPFGRDALNALIGQGEKVVGVITPPDRTGQKQIPPVKELAVKLQLPLHQPRRLKSPEAQQWVADLRPDLLVLAFVTDFIPKEMIALAACGGINYHPSLLPKYRGGSAINWAIICGEKETGVTIHQIDEGVDTGPVVLQEKVAIDPADTVKSLYFQKLYPLGIELIARAARLIRDKQAHPVAQDESKASFQPVIKETDVIIDWSQPTQILYNLIRGADPHPGATTRFQGAKLKIWEAKPFAAGGRPGEIGVQGTHRGFTVATGDGALLVERVQYADSGKISAGEFIGTFAVRSGQRLGS